MRFNYLAVDKIDLTQEMEERNRGEKRKKHVSKKKT